MTRIFIFGVSGKMGRFIVDMAKENPNCEVVGGFDVFSHPEVPTYTSVDDVPDNFDVIVDFSRAEVLPSVTALCLKYGKPAVLASTGYSDDQVASIKTLSEKVAILRSGNMSLGVNLILDLVEKATSVLADFDVEIVEKHHNQKADAPSGTALMLADKVKGVREDARFLYGREGASKREKQDVTIHAVRGGSIVGEHDVIFAGADEIVTISHTALSRKIFANGAIKASLFLHGKKSGLYSMKDALK